MVKRKTETFADRILSMKSIDGGSTKELDTIRFFLLDLNATFTPNSQTAKLARKIYKTLE